MPIRQSLKIYSKNSSTRDNCRLDWRNCDRCGVRRPSPYYENRGASGDADAGKAGSGRAKKEMAQLNAKIRRDKRNSKLRVLAENSNPQGHCLEAACSIWKLRPCSHDDARMAIQIPLVAEVVVQWPRPAWRGRLPSSLRGS